MNAKILINLNYAPHIFGWDKALKIAKKAALCDLDSIMMNATKKDKIKLNIIDFNSL